MIQKSKVALSNNVYFEVCSKEIERKNHFLLFFYSSLLLFVFVLNLSLPILTHLNVLWEPHCVSFMHEM